MPLFHALLDSVTEALRIGSGVRSELVPQFIAVVAGSHDVRTVLAAILLGHQVFACCLQAGGLAQGKPVCGSEGGPISEPHRKLAVIATATLQMEGSIAGRGIALGHGGILEARGRISRRLVCQDAQAPAAVQLQAQHRG